MYLKFIKVFFNVRKVIHKYMHNIKHKTNHYEALVSLSEYKNHNCNFE